MLSSAAQGWDTKHKFGCLWVFSWLWPAWLSSPGFHNMLTCSDCICSLHPRLYHLEDLCGLLCWGQAHQLGFSLLKFYLLVIFFYFKWDVCPWVQLNGTEAHRVKGHILFSTFSKVNVVLTCASADIPSCPRTHCSMFLFSMLNWIVPSVSCSSCLQTRYLCQLILCHHDWAVRAQTFGPAWIWACLWGVSGWGEHWVGGLCKADGPPHGGLHLPTGKGRGNGSCLAVQLGPQSSSVLGLRLERRLQGSPVCWADTYVCAPGVSVPLEKPK